MIESKKARVVERRNVQNMFLFLSTPCAALTCLHCEIKAITHVYAINIYCGVDLLNCKSRLIPTWIDISK